MKKDTGKISLRSLSGNKEGSFYFPFENKRIDIREIPLDKLKTHPALRDIDMDHVEELKRRIALHGYDARFPIAVNIQDDIEQCMALPAKYFEVLDGLHRITAMNQLKFRAIPAVIYKDLTEEEKLKVMIESNTQKEFDFIDYGKIFYYLYNDLGYSLSEIARKFRFSSWKYISNAISDYLAHRKWKSIPDLKLYLKKKHLQWLYKGPISSVKYKDILVDHIYQAKINLRSSSDDILHRLFMEWKSRYSLDPSKINSIVSLVEEESLYNTQIVLKSRVSTGMVVKIVSVVEVRTTRDTFSGFISYSCANMTFEIAGDIGASRTKT